MVLIWAEAASDDLQRIFDQIAQDSPQGALLVDVRICEQTDDLANFPQQGRVGKRKGTRELVIDKTPYIAVYRLEEDSVRIIRVLHGAQRWPRKL